MNYQRIKHEGQIFVLNEKRHQAAPFDDWDDAGHAESWLNDLGEEEADLMWKMFLGVRPFEREQVTA